MSYYKNSVSGFIDDINSKNIFKILKKFNEENSKEFISWKNSLPALALVLGRINNKANINILIEYHTKFIDKRIDVLLVGDHDVVVVELKQWTILSVRNAYVKTPYAEEVHHPILQAKEYADILNNYLFYNSGYNSKYCCFLHNITSEKETAQLNKYSLAKELSFTSENASKRKFVDFINSALEGNEIYQTPILQVLAEKKLQHAPSVIDDINNLVSTDDFHTTILQEQRNFYMEVLKNVHQEKTIFVLEGRAGSGKTVVGLKLLIELTKKNIASTFSVDSSFLYNVIKDSNISVMHPYTITQKHNLRYKYIILDEAHRIRENDFIKLMNQTDNLILLIDDYQKIESHRINTRYIKDFANLNNLTYKYIKLKHQIRSQGGNNYENWVYSLFTTTPMTYTNNNDFSIQIYDDINTLEDSLNKHSDKKLVAGFTWKWNEPNSDGSLPLDINISNLNWKKSWNSKKLKQSKQYKRFYEDNTLNEVACIFTIQGVEYDYIGLIFGYDIDYDFKTNSFVYFPNKNESRDLTSTEIKNIYITLLSRAKKGIYIFAVNPNVTKMLKRLVIF